MARQPITLQFETFEMDAELESVETEHGRECALYVDEREFPRVLDPAEVDDVKSQGAFIKLPLGRGGRDVPLALQVDEPG